MDCPHCNSEIGVSIAAIADYAYMLRTLCKTCGSEFLIVDGFPMTDEQYSFRLSPPPEHDWDRHANDS